MTVIKLEAGFITSSVKKINIYNSYIPCFFTWVSEIGDPVHDYINSFVQ